MAKTDDEFHGLMQRVMKGSEEAARELFREYGPYLIVAIRRHLTKRMRSKFDSLDFAQDVWASFFAESRDLRAFTSPKELVAFLGKLARNKIVDARRHRLTQKRASSKEMSLDDSVRVDRSGIAGSEPTPSQIVMRQEEWDAFLGEKPEAYRHIFVLLSEGKSHEEIAAELGLHRRTVDRIIQRYGPRQPVES
jgi:RNA polymerase sigma-70 factor (ECF subfamily)